MKSNWKKYPAHFTKEGSECFWQKLILEKDGSKVFANITKWKMFGKIHYSLDMQIPEEISITGMTINAENFHYEKLDLKTMESHAKKINKFLTKKR